MARTRFEDGGRWHRSTASGASGNCVEVAFTGGDNVYVRDSKDPDGGVLRFTSDEWRAFVNGVRQGEFDV